MKISIIQGAFFPVPPIYGGAVEKIWFRLGQEFALLGHDVTHISRLVGGLRSDEVIADVRHLRVPGYSQPRGITLLKCFDFLYSARACRKVPRDSDIVVTNTFFSPWLLPDKLRAKAYISVERAPKGQMKFYRNAERLRACSKAIKEAIYNELPESMHTLVSYIPNPFPFDPPIRPDVSKLDRILYCGRIHPEKGMDLLVQAGVGLNWPIDAVGPQSVEHGGGGKAYVASIMHAAAELGSNTTFFPPVFDVSALNALYERSAIFVYPSIAEAGEAGPVAPREAMAWGCVPVVSDLECFRDVIQHEQNGLVFNHRARHPHIELANALKRLIQDESLRRRLAAEAIKVSETLSPAVVARKFLSDFDYLIQCRLHCA